MQKAVGKIADDWWAKSFTILYIVAKVLAHVAQTAGLLVAVRPD